MSLGPREALLGSRVPHSLFPSHRSPLCIRRDRDATCPVISLFCLSPYCPFFLQLKRMPLYLFNCAIGSQGMCTQVVQSGLGYNSFIKSTNTYKARLGATHISHWVLSICRTLPCLCTCATVIVSFKTSLSSLPGDCHGLRTGLPASWLVPSIQTATESLLICKADDIRLLLKPSGPPHGFQARV